MDYPQYLPSNKLFWGCFAQGFKHSFSPMVMINMNLTTFIKLLLLFIIRKLFCFSLKELGIIGLVSRWLEISRAFLRINGGHK